MILGRYSCIQGDWALWHRVGVPQTLDPKPASLEQPLEMLRHERDQNEVTSYRINGNQMETTIEYWGYIGIMEKKMETTMYYILPTEPGTWTCD